MTAFNILKIAQSSYLLRFIEQVRFPTLVFMVSFALFVVVRDYAFLGAPEKVDTPWDAAWYRRVIENGYWTDGNTSAYRNIVFLPLYPLACAAAKSLFTMSTANAMLAVSAASTLIMLIVMYNLLTPKYPAFVVKMTVLLLAFGPFSVFLYNGYSEPLFLVLLMLFFWAVLREQYIVASIFVGIASAARPHAPILGIVIAFEIARRYYAQYGLRLHLRAKYLHQLLLSIPLCFAGLAAYTLWLGYRFDDPLAFMHGYVAWSTGGGEFNMLDVFGFHYLLKGMAQGAFTFGVASPRLTGIILFAVVPVMLLWLRKEVFPSGAFFIVLMFLFLHVTMLQHSIEIVNLGRHFSLLPPVPLMFALAVEPKRIGRLLVSSNVPERMQDERCCCLHALCLVPSLLLLSAFVLLYIYYTVMFYRIQFVS